MRYRITAFLLLSIHGSAVFACATCLCGDPTLTTMGVEKPFAGRTRIAVDYLSRGETVGEANIEEHLIEETRATYTISYAPNVEWMFSASIPMINKSVDRFDLSHEEGSGIGDTDLAARWFIGKATSISTPRLWGLHFGLRLPTTESYYLNHLFCAIPPYSQEYAL